MASFKSVAFFAPQYMPGDGVAIIVTDKVVPTAAALNDTYDFKIPAGMEVTNVELQCDALDSGTDTIAFSVGYSPIQAETVYTEDLTYFAAAGQATMRAGGRLSCAFKPKKFEEDVMLRVKLTAAANVFAAGEVHAIVHGNAKGVR